MFHTEKDKLSLLFLLITAVGAAHMFEQVIFGIEEFYMLRDAVGGWYALFPESMNGEASVVLITIVFVAISVMLYAVMRGGAAQLGAGGLVPVVAREVIELQPGTHPRLLDEVRGALRCAAGVGVAARELLDEGPDSHEQPVHGFAAARLRLEDQGIELVLRKH